MIDYFESAEGVIEYWFSDHMKQHWFSSTAEIDKEIQDKYESIWGAAVKGQLENWKSTPQGCLALVIILDQFPLNMFRGQAKSFSTEAQAIAITRHAIALDFDKVLTTDQCAFLYMPLMHSENLVDQDCSVALYQQACLDSNLRFARHHREIVKKFGRFPHRNRILGRESTADELAYLDSPQAFKG